jgi:GNAT superfamily N-acetyltransferase
MAAASVLRRGAVCALLVLACAAGTSAARAQMGSVEMPPAEDEAPVEVRPGGVACGTLNARAMEASLVIRQHASALSAGVDPDARAQGVVLLAYLDQWAGRLRGLIDLGEFADCMDDGEAETYRRALATATRVGNQAREELYRPVRAPQQPTQQRNRRP